MEEAVLARHGESEASVKGLLNGDPSLPVGLTDAGQLQARQLGVMLAGQRFELCVTSEFERTRLTAQEALAGRELPRLVLPALNDPRYGSYEGGALADYRAWAAAASSGEDPPGGGESRFTIIARYARAFRVLLARPERSILVVAHSLPIALALSASSGTPPRPRAELVPYATPFALERSLLERAACVVEGWLAAPDW